MMRPLLMMGIAAGLLPAAEVSGPMLGMVHDPVSGAVLPARGIPGSAYFGQAILEGFASARIANGVVLGLTSEGKACVVRNGETLELGAADQIALSPAGDAAALWSKETSTIRTFRLGELSAELPASGDVTLLAVSDDAGAVIAGIAGTLHLLSREHGETSLGEGTRASFLPRSHAGVLAMAAGVARLTADGQVEQLFEMTAEDVAADRERIVAVSSDGQIAIWSEGADPLRMHCDCTPDRAETLSNGILRLTGKLNEPVWILDLNGREPRLLFIPAARSANE